jgi:hypothetical protein
MQRWPTWLAWTTCAALTVATVVLSTSLTRSEVGEDIARAAAQAYRRLPDAQRNRTVVYGESYFLAAFLDRFAPEFGLPKAYGGNRGYGYFAPPPDDHDAVVYVGRDPRELTVS